MIELNILGIPKPGGSKRAFPHKTTGRIIVTDDCKTSKDWRNAVTIQANDQFQGEMFTGPVCVDVSFFMPRPKSHYRTGKHAGRLKPNAPVYHDKKPDVLKLMRSTEDALTDAGVWRDDALVVEETIRKYYANGRPPGAVIRIEEMET